jgi:DNA polymerase I-like protein with 3'-5' exonuclease and polymerase domains
MYEVPDSWEDYQNAAHDGLPCGFDTGLAWHACNETGDFGLTAMTLRFTSAPRYDVELDEWKRRYCLDNGLKDKDLEGYGMCPREILIPYANADADVTRRIAIKLRRCLDRDRHGNNCWEAFWRNMRAYQAVIEINTTGITVDRGRLDRLAELYVSAKEQIRSRIREWSNWGGDDKAALNLESVYQVREWLFGERYNGKKREHADVPVRIRPKGAKSLQLTPTLSNDKRPILWDEVIERGLENDKMPSTKGQALSLLEQNAKASKRVRTKSGRIKHVEVDHAEQVRWLRDYRFIAQVLKLTLRPPKLDKNDTYEVDEDGDYIYEKGLPASICDDGRVRTHIYPTLETCRWASSRPNLTNCSKRREKDYKRILGDLYKWPIRTIFRASPGHVLVEADFIGAELLGAAIMSGDAAMIDHCRRNQLPEHHPDYYDIHSQVAVRAFRLRCEPTKSGLDSIGKSNLRIVAKAVIFGLMYGRGAKAISVAAQEEKIPLTRDEAQKIIDTIFEMYPDLEPFFAACRERATEPGWLCNCFGQFRRFPTVLEEKQIGDFERQAMNFPMQSLVAGAMSQALDNLLQLRKKHKVGKSLFRIVLQIHDAVLLEVPVEHVAEVVDNIIPAAMVDGVPIYRTHLDGMPADDKPYHMGVDTNIYTYWGENLMPDDCKKLNVHPKYAGFIKATDGGWTHREMKAGQKWLKGRWVPLTTSSKT